MALSLELSGILHDPKKVDRQRSWRLTFGVCPIQPNHLIPRPSAKNAQVEYCDEILHTHWYWQDLAQGNVKCHMLLVEALRSSKFCASVLGQFAKIDHNFWTIWNILIEFCLSSHRNVNKNARRSKILETNMPYLTLR